MLQHARRRCLAAAGARTVWSHARPLQVRQVWQDGNVDGFVARPLEIVETFKILPRDLRLLKTRGANIAVRPDYFLFRLPPFTGCVRRDSCLLLTEGLSAATDVLQDTLISQIQLPTEEDALQTTLFELRVLEVALREDLLSKQERFTRLASLIHTVSAQRGGLAAFATPRAPLSSVISSSSSATEHTLYRLLTLSNSLGALEVDVRRTFAALTALLGNDEDMATMYLSHKAMEGEQRPVEEHTEVELMLEAFATQLEDLLDRVSGLRETVATHRTLEARPPPEPWDMWTWDMGHGQHDMDMDCAADAAGWPAPEPATHP